VKVVSCPKGIIQIEDAKGKTLKRQETGKKAA
jgi:hypothetical protein